MASSANPISGDLAPFLFDAKVGVALLRVAGVESQAEGGVESGMIKAVVVECLRPDMPAPGASVSFAFARTADALERLHQGVNAWNTLRLDPGSRALVAWVALDAGRGLYAVRAAAPIAEGDSRELAETKAALAVQSLPPGSPQHESRLGESLLAGKDILRRYACAALTTRALLPRETSARLFAQAIESPKTNRDDDETLAGFMIDAPLFDADKGDDAPNAQVLTLLARQLVRVEPKATTMWLRYLFSRVMPELAEDPQDDWAKRRALLRCIQVPPKVMSDRLTLLSTLPGPDAESAAELAAAWKKALAP